MLTIVRAPNPVLGEKAEPVKEIDKEINYLIDQMKETLDATKDPRGIGLAAPQVGKALQLFLIKPTDNSKFQIFINPKIEEIVEVKTPKVKNGPTKLEGCLSLPNIWGEVARNKGLVLNYLDGKGNPHRKEFNGFTATIIQHEYDHLNGILFPKRVLEQNKKLYKSYKDEKGEDVFEEIEL